MSIVQTLTTGNAGIEQIEYVNSPLNCLVIRASDGQIKVMKCSSPGGEEKILPILSGGNRILVKDGLIFVLNEKEVLGWNLEIGELVLQELMELSIIAFSDDGEFFIGVSAGDYTDEQRFCILYYRISTHKYS